MISFLLKVTSCILSSLHLEVCCWMPTSRWQQGLLERKPDVFQSVLAKKGPQSLLQSQARFQVICWFIIFFVSANRLLKCKIDYGEKTQDRLCSMVCLRRITTKKAIYSFYADWSLSDSRVSSYSVLPGFKISNSYRLRSKLFHVINVY